MIKQTIIFILVFLLLISCEKRTSSSPINQSGYLDFKSLKKKKNVNIDSIYQVISLSKEDTVKVNNLMGLFSLTIRNRPLRPEFLDEAIKISRRINYNTGLANALNKKGVNARYDHNYLKSVKLHKEALLHYKQSWDTESRIKNLNSLGVSYRKLNMEEEALIYYFKALDLSEKAEHTRSMAMALNGIGNAYLNQKKYQQAKTYFKLALHFEDLIDNEKGMGYDYSNLGEVYMYEKKYDSSYAYHMKSLKIARKIGHKDNIAIINNTIGNMFQHKGEYEKALKYFDKAIPVLEKFRSKRYLSNTLINKGVSYCKLGQYKEAEENILKGLEKAVNISSKENIILGYKALSDLYDKEGDYKKSLKEYKQMTAYRDSMFNIHSDNNIVAMGIKYNTEKKDQQIQKLNLESKIQKGRLLILFLAIGLLVIFVLFFYFYNRLRLKNKQLEIDEMQNNIKEYMEHISELENEDCRDSKQMDLARKIEEYGLSSREAEVLKYISQGLKNKEIADIMFISLSTVKTHTKNIFDKMDVRNRMEAVRKAQIQ